MGYIYKITNQINNKIYIGKTEDADPNDRWKQHLQDVNRRRCEKRPLYDAMNKYGTENFSFEVIDYCDNSNELCEKEKYYIEKFRTYIGFPDCNGYNATIGGDGKPYLQLNEDEVVNYHVAHGRIAGHTAKNFGVDLGTVKKILKKNNISWLSCAEITEYKYIEQFGGLAMIDVETLKIQNTFRSPKYVFDTYPSFNLQTISLAANPNHKSHHKAYGYLWYRFIDLPQQILSINGYMSYKEIKLLR